MTASVSKGVSVKWARWKMRLASVLTSPTVNAMMTQLAKSLMYVVTTMMLYLAEIRYNERPVALRLQKCHAGSFVLVPETELAIHI